MTIEEKKAKAYDEALELMQDCIPDKNGFVRVRPEDIFPELKESEDEKVRKEIIKYLSWIKDRDGSYMPNNIPFDDMIVWLEKQGEQKSDSFCKKHCKGFQETGKCFADGDCKAKREADSIDKA